MPSEQLEKILERYPEARRDKLIPILQEIQENFGYLNEETISKLGKYLHLPTSKIYGIATFYNQFSFVPKGKYHIRLCNGSSCHINGGNSLIRAIEKTLGLKQAETTKDGLFSLEIVSCLGACSRAPVIEVNEEFFNCPDAFELNRLIDSFRKKSTQTK